MLGAEFRTGGGRLGGGLPPPGEKHGLRPTAGGRGGHGTVAFLSLNTSKVDATFQSKVQVGSHLLVGGN